MNALDGGEASGKQGLPAETVEEQAVDTSPVDATANQEEDEPSIQTESSPLEVPEVATSVDAEPADAGTLPQ